MTGKFIVFEGLDGSGLSTQAMMLKEHLLKGGRKAVLTKEQTDNLIGGMIKSSLKGHIKVSPLTLQLMFVADRSHHLESEIEPALKDDKIVISDRYLFSTLAFGSLDVDIDFLKLINSKFRKPDITFIIDCKPDTCIGRISRERFHIEMFEEKEKLEKVKANYASLKDYFPNVHIIDGNRSKEEIFEDIKNIAEKNL
jgi:dTMP kinase